MSQWHSHQFRCRTQSLPRCQVQHNCQRYHRLAVTRCRGNQSWSVHPSFCLVASANCHLRDRNRAGRHRQATYDNDWEVTDWILLLDWYLSHLVTSASRLVLSSCIFYGSSSIQWHDFRDTGKLWELPSTFPSPHPRTFDSEDSKSAGPRGSDKLTCSVEPQPRRSSRRDNLIQ
jgi:hypothetical protein